jgi:hypothetical protein
MTNDLKRFYDCTVSLLIFTEICRADPFDTWTWRNPFPTGSHLAEVAYGNGRYVALGGNGATATSPDGVNWVQGHQLPLGITLIARLWQGRFVAVGWAFMSRCGDFLIQTE